MNLREPLLRGLADIEMGKHVKILYAVESGSRAWGFASQDSDYDVRFLYAHPTAWYLSINEGRDVIERPLENNLDFSGWDVRKALALFRKSNPPLLEWLGSPIIYLEKYSTAQRMRELLPTYYSPTACLYHYLHMARGNYREYLRGEVVWVKKYFYVLRPLLALHWIEQGLGAAPTDFNVMVERLVTDPELRAAIDNLLAEKRAGAELREGPRIPVISAFIESEMARLEQFHVPRDPRPFPSEPLNELFRATLREVWR
ncbi:MAG: nucleotidyltransferase domain-containing protein [Chloroflexi bacterium]|nr:nucleotidyltransferase domain-containing protein [Chloroflexota bacterium]